MKNELQIMRDELQEYKELSFYKRIQKSIQFKNESTYIIKRIELELNHSKLNEKELILAFKIIEYLKNQKSYFLTKQIKNEFEFVLIHKKFMLAVQFALQKNRFNYIPLNEFPLVLYIAFLVSLREHTGYGKKFLKQFISLADYIGLPIILFCSSKLIPYYSKFSFRLIDKNPNFENNYLMAYFPKTMFVI